ncbi:hypothetical protein MTR67_053377 [Solanum verrucosum]|uniref:Uncharacterized protein n=1 Tax=Solanum verrucosum TaxID=315347 RepID=A0AAF0V7X3_SOLVR|nr:hypothetical protein MTR67_053377 [Solanum verrucosum]
MDILQIQNSKIFTDQGRHLFLGFFSLFRKRKEEWMARIDLPSSHTTWRPSKRAEDAAGRTNFAGGSALLQLKLFEDEGDEAQLYGPRAVDAV